MEDLVRLTARDAVALLRSRELSPEELIDAALARIETVEGAVNALPTLAAERARAAARAAAWDVTEPGALHGLPIAIKDLTDVEGVRTTYGSPIFSGNVPTTSDIGVRMLEARGAIVLAKSNTPEFGAGANTFNEVFGATRNPWDTRLTCGGSSGGSAVALATGEVWLATGSDLGGSLRTPASFCSVVGLRPSPGRCARTSETPFNTLSVAGPMARNVGDLGLMLDAMAGAHAGDPLALERPAIPFQTAAETPVPPARIGFSPDLGFLPVMPEIARISEAAAARFSELGTEVTAACPDLADAPEIFQTLRAAGFASGVGRLLADHADRLKPEVVWNIEKGLALAATDVGRAEARRGALVQRMAAFLDTHDLLVCPAAPVPPFDVDIRYVTEIEGQKLDTYIDWIAITFCLTLTGCPVLVLPCGFTEAGLPVGIQLVGRPRGEAALLSAAAAAEALFGLASRLPIDPRVRARPETL